MRTNQDSTLPQLGKVVVTDYRQTLRPQPVDLGTVVDYIAQTVQLSALRQLPLSRVNGFDHTKAEARIIVDNNPHILIHLG